MLTLAAEPLFVGSHVRSVITAVGIVCLGVSVSGQERHRVDSLERTEIRLLAEAEHPSSGPRTEVFLRLPDHVTFREGSSLELNIDMSSPALPHVAGLRVALNQETLSCEPSVSGSSLRAKAAVPPKLLQSGWNQVAIELVHTNSAGARALAEPRGWTLKGSNTVLRLAYKRMRAFPELGRFPHSFVEEKLLGATETNLAQVFLPNVRRNVYARALAVTGVRFGQIDYVKPTDLRVRHIRDWPTDNPHANAVIIGISAEIPIKGVPGHIESRLRRLRPGEGLIAEWILDDRRRCLMVTGADDLGLENAVLTVGSSPALIWAAPSPFAVNSPPESRDDLAYLARPHAGSLTFDALGWSPLFLRGSARQQSVHGWRLPPGYALSQDSRLELNVISGPGLTSSSMEVVVNGTMIGAIKLTPAVASLTSARIDLPAGLRGQDPMTLTFRTRLSTSSNAVPWISVLGTSRLVVRPNLCDPSSLDGVPGILFSDPFLNQLAFGIPERSSWEELNYLFSQMMHLGRQLPSAAILQPDAMTFSASKPLVPERLHNRHVIVLGSAAEWSEALPPFASLAVRLNSPDTVMMQGRTSSLDLFDSHLGIVQLLKSPWDDRMRTVVLGGWNSLTAPALDGVLARADGRLLGNIAVLDNRGRAAAYDTRTGNHISLAEHIRSKLPPGMDEDETRTQLEAHQVLAGHSARVNLVVWIVAPTLLCFLVGARIWFTWDQNQRRKRALEGEKPLVI